MKPILFNTDMVQAILDGRKAVTRRLVKPQPKPSTQVPLGYLSYTNGSKEDGCHAWGLDEYGGTMSYAKPPYNVGDFLYVRETFCPNYFDDCIAVLRDGNKNAYKTDYNKDILGEVVPEPKWHPSIHMPKEAARIFLRVTGVRVERLQDITNEEAEKEGVDYKCPYEHRVYMNGYDSMCYVEGDCHNSIRHCDMSCIEEFSLIWNSTIKKRDLDQYGWNSNPWVWVIEFERISKEDANCYTL